MSKKFIFFKIQIFYFMKVKTRPLSSLSLTSKIFVVVIFLESIVLIGLTCERISTYIEQPLIEEERHIKEGFFSFLFYLEINFWIKTNKAILIIFNSIVLSLYAINGVHFKQFLFIFFVTIILF